MSSQTYSACIEACNACAVACNHCATACLKEYDVKAMAKCIARDTDCAQVCVVAAAALARGSEHIQAICRMCAEVCQACGDECAMHDMAHCQACERACHVCAEECRKMAAIT